MGRAQVVFAVLLLGTWVAGPASAAAVGSTPSDALPHCVVTAVEVGSPAPAAAPRCYATFADAIAAATNGRVRLPADAQTVDQRTLDDKTGIGSNGLQTGSSIVIGIEYQHKDFGGWSYVIQSTNGRGCYGYSYRVPSLPSNRNNEISSARSYGGCKSGHYSGTNMTGSRYLCGCSQMGAMNDQTSSILFSATGYRR